MKYIFSLIIIFLGLSAFSQDQVLNAGYSIQERKKILENISILEPDFQRNPTNEKAIRLADAFLYIKKYKKAISYYEYALSIEDLNETQMENYFSALFEFGDIKLASEVSKDFYVRFKKMHLKSKVDSFESLSKSTPVYLDNYLAMNTTSNEYGLYPLFADYRIINSDKPVTINQEEVSSISPYAVSIMDTANERPQLYALMKNDKYVNSISHYDAKDKKIYITRNNSTKFNVKLNANNQSNMKIFIGNIDDFFNITNLTEFPYNSNDYSVGQPCISQDGQILYFVSDMPGGFGGTDIYRCMKLENGTWGAPINLGNVINTSGDEMFPYISPQGNALYFSSTGHSIFGGLDINKSNKTRFNVFSKPTNMGLPFNSNKDDFAIVFLDNYGSEGYFSSNRLDGVGGVDIYHFNYEKKEELKLPKAKNTKASKTIKATFDSPKKDNIIVNDDIDFREKKKVSETNSTSQPTKTDASTEIEFSNSKKTAPTNTPSGSSDIQFAH